MKYYVEESLSNFKFWSGGKDRAELLNSDQFDSVEELLEEMMPETVGQIQPSMIFSGLTLAPSANGLGIRTKNIWKRIYQMKKSKMLKIGLIVLPKPMISSSSPE